MPARDSRPSFNSGEISDETDARFDISKFSSACEVLENFIPMPTGGARKRGGFIHVAETKNTGTSKARLIPFRFSTGTNFVCMFEAGSIRFFSNQVEVESGGSPYEISNPYTEAQLFDLHYTQINDVVYVVHPEVAPYKLTRFGDTNWTFEEVDWDYPPFLSQNTITDITVTPGGLSGEGQTLTAEATAWAISTEYNIGDVREDDADTGYIYKCILGHTSDGTTMTTDLALDPPVWELVEVFTSEMVDGYFELSQPRLSTTVEISNLDTISSPGSSSNIVASESVYLYTTGTWDGELILQRSRDSGTTWDDILVWTSASDKNFEQTLTLDEEVTLRWYYTRSSAPGNTPVPRAVIDVASATRNGYGKIATVTDSVSATIDIERSFESTDATYTWSEGAWSDRRGFPRAVTLHEQRLCFGGTSTSAQTVWLSGTGDYEDFNFGTNAASPFTVTLGSTTFNGVQWMQSKKNLVIGTTGGEFAIAPASDSEALAPTNVSIINDTNFGSDNIQPVLLNEALVYVARANSAVMELSYSFSADKYVSPELTLLASHIVQSGIDQMDVQRGRWAQIWAVTGDGFLGGLTYERSQDVVAWFRATTATGDTIESCATVYGSGDDELWVVVKRAKGDGSGYTRSVEYMDFGAWDAQDNGDTSAVSFLDCATVYNGASTTTVTIPSFLVGRTLKLVADGSVEEDVTPTSTTVTLTTAATKVVVGLGYEAKIQPTRPEIQLQSGSSSAARKRIASVSVKMKDTGYFYLYDHNDTSRANPVLVTQHSTSEDVCCPPDLMTRVTRESIPNDWDEEPGYLLVSDSPLPCTILGLTHEYSIGQRT